MYPASFDYHRPTRLDEALELLGRGGEARPLAGGQSLLPAMKLRLAVPEALVDLGGIEELRGIERNGDVLRIGAMARYADVLASEAVRANCPVLAECVRVVGDPQVRNVGTIGGSVAHADPAADLPTLLLALDAEIEVAGSGGRRTVPARDFFLGMFSTALEEGELVTGVRIPMAEGTTGAAYEKHPHPASRYAVVGVAAWLRLEGDRCAEAALAVGGVTGGPVRIEAAAEALRGRAPGSEAIEEAASQVSGALEQPLGDSYASGEYRVHLARVMAGRALRKAAERASG